MHRLEREEFTKGKYIGLWSLLAFQAGFINAFGFLACGRYVSHVTGVGTQVGLMVGQSTPWLALELMGFPVAFVLGSFFSGTLTISRIERGLNPHTLWVIALIPVLLLALAIGGNSGMFGVFGEMLLLPHDFALLYSLSAVCGMQNGCFATMTKGQIRTTHLTGISTDIGTDLARAFLGNLPAHEYKLTWRTNISRMVTFLGFSIGSVFSVYYCSNHGFLSLLIPAATSTIALVVVVLWQRSITVGLRLARARARFTHKIRAIQKTG